MPQSQPPQCSLGMTGMAASSAFTANIQEQDRSVPPAHQVPENPSATQNQRVRSTMGANSITQALSIDLSCQNLQHIPENLIDTTKDQLERLSVAYNFLTDFPIQLPDCTYLRYLNARNNHLVTFPLPICHLYRLEILDLGNNRLTAIPEDIANLSVLKVLSVSQNFLTKLPYCTGRMASLKLLKVDGNPLVFPPAKLLAPTGNKESADFITTQRIMEFFEQNVYSQSTTQITDSSISAVASTVVQSMAPLHTILRILGSSSRHTVALQSNLERTLSRAIVHLRELQLTIDFADDESLGGDQQLREASTTVLNTHMRICLEVSSCADVLIRNAKAHNICTLLVLMHTTTMELRAVLGKWGTQKSFKAFLLSVQQTCDLVQASLQPLHDHILAGPSQKSLCQNKVDGLVQVEERQQLAVICSSTLSKAKSFHSYATSFILTEPQFKQFASFKQSFTNLISCWTQFGDQLKAQRGTLRIPTNIKLQLQNTQVNLKRCTQLFLAWERRIVVCEEIGGYDKLNSSSRE